MPPLHLTTELIHRIALFSGMTNEVPASVISAPANLSLEIVQAADMFLTHFQISVVTELSQ